MKRLIVLLIVLAGGLAWAAFSVPSNAATVNGTGISQANLNSDVSAIADSAYYQCYLNSEAYLSSNGSEQLPSVVGAGTGQYAGDHPTATTGFTANYLETEIAHQLLLQVASKRNVTVTPAELATARTNLTEEITSVMSEILQTQQGQDVRYGCSLTGQPITGKQVLDTMPASFVDDAGAVRGHGRRAGGGPGRRRLERQPTWRTTTTRTARTSTRPVFTAAVFASESAAQDAAAQVAFGTPFATVASNTASSGGGDRAATCWPTWSRACRRSAHIQSLATGAVSDPISANGKYFLLQITSRTPTPYAKAKAAVANAVQAKGATATRTALTALEGRSDVSVNPQYGVWVPVNASVLAPLAPAPSDVLNASANVGRVAPASVSGSASTTPPAAERDATPPRHGGGPRAGRSRPRGGQRRRRCCGAPRGGPSCARRATRPRPGSPDVPSFDHLYESAGTFDEVYAGIVEALVAAALEAGPDGVVYAVPGSPLVAERTVDLLRADGRVAVTALPALSFLDLAWVALGVDPLAEGVRLADAEAFGPALAERGGPFLVAQCWSRHLLSEVKLAVARRRGRGAAPAGAAAPPRSRRRGGRRRRLVGDRPHTRARPPHVALHPGLRPRRRPFRRRGGGRTGRPHGHAARALSVGLRPDPRLAHAPPRRGELRGVGRAGRARRR